MLFCLICPNKDIGPLKIRPLSLLDIRPTSRRQIENGLCWVSQVRAMEGKGLLSFFGGLPQGELLGEASPSGLDGSAGCLPWVAPSGVEVDVTASLGREAAGNSVPRPLSDKHSLAQTRGRTRPPPQRWTSAIHWFRIENTLMNKIYSQDHFLLLFKIFFFIFLNVAPSSVKIMPMARVCGSCNVSAGQCCSGAAGLARGCHPEAQRLAGRLCTPRAGH